MKLSESWTWPKAEAVCISPPSRICPRKKRGATTIRGKMTAACPYPAVNHVSRFCWRIMPHQLRTMLPKRSRKLRSSSASPW